MKKLKLEALAVESFDIETAEAERGTVAGHDASAQVTCFGQDTCGARYTCANSCVCDPSEIYSCVGWC